MVGGWRNRLSRLRMQRQVWTGKLRVCAQQSKGTNGGRAKRRKEERKKKNKKDEGLIQKVTPNI